MSDRLPPQASESERALLGCLLRHPEKLSDLRDVLTVDDFYFHCHQRVYSAILCRADSHRPFDLLGVRDELASRGELADVGGDVYLAELCGDGVYGHEWHAGRVRDASARRSAIRAAAELIESAYLGTAAADELVERARGDLDQIATRSAGSESVPIAEAFNQLLDEIDARVRGDRRSGTATGFTETDRALCGGLPTGCLTILAARPSVGKTSWACHVSRNVCGRGGSVLFVSLEQPTPELTERLTAGAADVSGRRIRTGILEGRHHDRISKAGDQIRAWRMRVSDRTGRTAGQIAAGVRSDKRKMKSVDLVAVDYLNLVKADNPRVTRNEQIGASATRLREMARELNVPVLLLCQLNREAAHNDSGPPKLHQLRDSGEIEQVADVVLFLHRTGPIPTAGACDQLELHVAKHRNGPLGVVKLEHESRVYTFAEVTGIPG